MFLKFQGLFYYLFQPSAISSSFTTLCTIQAIMSNLCQNLSISKNWPLICINCDESVSRGRETGTKGRETGTKGRRTGTIGTKERGNEKPYGLVQIDYWDRGTSPRHVWTWRGRVTPFLDV